MAMQDLASISLMMACFVIELGVHESSFANAITQEPWGQTKNKNLN